MTDTIEFVVENAGCESCAVRVRTAVEPLAAVREIQVDEAADVATVLVDHTLNVSEDAIDRVLRAASEGAGHVYRVRPGSWRARADVVRVDPA